MIAVKIDNLSYSYGEQKVLKDISLEINQGEFLAIVGKNGSGKSTLARLINGLLTPSQGEIEVFGLNTKNRQNHFEIRKSCGIVFQNPDNQMVASIVEDDVAFGPENIGLDRKEIGERIEFALKATNSQEFRLSPASRLSGGQKQRVAISGVLALKPKILILDESTSMLDPKAREEVMEVVKKLNKYENMTVIVITHYMDEVVDCGRVVVLNNGNLVDQGTPEEIFSREGMLVECGLDLPLSLKISRLLKENGVDVGENLTKEALKERLCELLRKI